MSGFNTFTYNNNPIINSFYDIASINLPTTQTYTEDQYNILAPTINGTPGYVLNTNNNIISIDISGGFSINNTGIYKISLCFSFDSSIDTSNVIVADFMLNSAPLISSTDVVGTNTIFDVVATGTPLTFNGLDNGLLLSNQQLSKNNIGNGRAIIYAGYDGGTVNNNLYAYFTIPNVMFCYDPAFTFARYYLSTNAGSCIPQVLCFESTVNIVSTGDNNTFYPCICPYKFSIWNTGNNNLPQAYLMVQMISSL
jgi:hypothetical protein